MNAESEEQVRAIRQKVAEERVMLEELERTFTHQSMKDSVKTALYELDDVEVFCLKSLESGVRTASEEAMVIRNSRVPLAMAISKRKQLQDSLKSKGAGAVLPD